KVEKDQLHRAEAVLRKLGIAEIRDRAFGALSTGQQRRCLLARALVHEPDTLVLDEPTSGLDLAAGFDYRARLGELARAGSSLVLVTHDLGDIIPEIVRVVILAQGRVVADGAKSSVLTGELLSRVYQTPIRVTGSEGHYLAYPGT
ncbi:MAG: ATP-binding cassette domain-containing protein, partial [Gammaproteobacteria bacterium]|nr:ATP-binding cassette domain-containing protein [Gammaproteobacteria bacterium]